MKMKKYIKWFKKRTKAQIFFFVFTISFTVATIFCSIATQNFANKQNYHPLLNQISPPIFSYYYNPLAIALWKKQFYTQVKEDFDSELKLVYTGFGASIIILIIGIIIIKSKKKSPTTHGSARWATEDELDDAGLTKPEGVMLGITQDGRYIRDNSPSHCLVYAPTRSGKGVGIIIPTLLCWKHSVIVTDVKGENWGITSGYRKSKLGNRVLKFDPTCFDGSSARFNPLEEVRVKTAHEVKDTQRLVQMIVDPQGKGELDHWGKTAAAMLTFMILYVLYCREEKNLNEVASLIADPDADMDEIFTNIAEERHADPELIFELYGIRTTQHPVISQGAIELRNKPDNERGSVISTAVSNLALYRDPIIKKNTSVSDFKISDLMNHDKPVSLYIVIPPSDLDRVVPLTRIIINQIITSLTEKMTFVDGKPVVEYKHRLLLLIDEFPAFGRIDTFEKALAFIAGYGLKALLIIQSINQINKAYTKDNSIMDNMHIQVAYTPNDNYTAEEISKALGKQTLVVDNKSYQKGFSFWFGLERTSQSEVGRELMTARELRDMPPDDEIVFMAGISPYKAKKIFYWKDHNFKKRLLPAPAVSDVIQIHDDETPPTPEPATAVPPAPMEFQNDLRDIAMSINAMPDILEAPEMPFMPPIVAGIEEASEEDKEMIQRILDNQPTDQSREEAIMNSSFIDSYDELAFVDFDALEREADEFDVM